MVQVLLLADKQEVYLQVVTHQTEVAEVVLDIMVVEVVQDMILNLMVQVAVVHHILVILK